MSGTPELADEDDGLEARFVRTVAVVGTLATLGMLTWRGVRVGLGFGLGAGFNLTSFYWLRAGLTAVFGGGTPRLGKLRFGTRLALLGICLYAIFISHLVPFTPVIWGLLAVPAGVFVFVILEAIRSLWNNSGSPTS